MEPAQQELQNVLTFTRINKPQITTFFNVDGWCHSSPTDIRHLLSKQIIKPVLWQQTIEAVLAFEFERIVEIGPGNVLSKLCKHSAKKFSKEIEIVNFDFERSEKSDIVER